MVIKVKQYKKTRGLTLIEVIIAMAIMMIVGGVITTMTVSNNKILSKVDMKSELQLEGQLIQTQLNSVAFESNGVKEVVFKGDTDEIESLTLYDVNYDYQFVLDHHTVIYRKIQGENVLVEKQLSSHVSKIVVIGEEDLEKSSYMEFNITLEMKRGGQVVDYQIDNYIVFRNFKR